ncbi:PREDICTED: synaptonemal complex central element protein 1-like [Dipodomys ordii]|uniref:Synaptonemal complex central element protein 1-like n=1 Tax=Dipodomys ordii TaxID=10020 RepID=A0A1S3EUQ3_DIPOR|nr:PREDICTED: synaptonemal complex central element protein 1-like [Dipodomys ordii]
MRAASHRHVPHQRSCANPLLENGGEAGAFGGKVAGIPGGGVHGGGGGRSLNFRRQAKSSKMNEDLLATVKKLQKEGSLEPQIKDLINRINELQQAKQTSNKELGEGQTLQEILLQQLDSLNGEEAHLEEVLRKKQEALKILQDHWHKKKSKAQWLDMGEQLEDLMYQHKDLWELQMLEQRLTQEIQALERSLEHLLAESEAGAGCGMGVARAPGGGWACSSRENGVGCCQSSGAWSEL